MHLHPCRPRTLAWAVLAACVLPWLVGEFAKQFYQPGLAADAERSTQLIDYLVIGSAVFGVTMVSTLAVGCWIVATLKGPRYTADSFPVDSPRPGLDDDARHAGPR